MFRRLLGFTLQNSTRSRFVNPQSLSKNIHFNSTRPATPRKATPISLQKGPKIRLYCTETPLNFEFTSDETLEALCEHIETLIDDNPQLSEADVTLASGVLNFVLPDPLGTYVINKQSPNKQIWLSSPISGPIRYDLQNSAWIYKHTQQSLHELLNKEIGQDILGLEDAGFEDLFCGRPQN